jgi:hypothetical protein
LYSGKQLTKAAAKSAIVPHQVRVLSEDDCIVRGPTINDPTIPKDIASRPQKGRVRKRPITHPTNAPGIVQSVFNWEMIAAVTDAPMIELENRAIVQPHCETFIGCVFQVCSRSIFVTDLLLI